MGTIALVAAATFAAASIGGLFALRFRDHLHLILGFSAGAVAGVAFFDLIPEAIELGTPFYGAESIALFAALGFFGYLVLDRLFLRHTHGEDGAGGGSRGPFAVVTLSVHSFFDGIAIGVAFQASVAVGLVVAAAVLTHGFSDGINTVNFILKNGGQVRQALRWLVLNAAAPALGIASTLFFAVPENVLGLVLAVFVGTFLYLSAGDLIPESYHRHPRALTTVMTLLGAGVLYVIIQVAG